MITLNQAVPQFNNDIAKTEGWWISRVDNNYFELQKLDEIGIFDSDEAAMLYVREKVVTGSGYHLDAALFLMENEPNEYIRMMSAGSDNIADHYNSVTERNSG